MPARKKKKIILIIEDEQTLLKAMSMKLMDRSYKVISAIDGKSGLQLAKSGQPDLILLDILLPVMDGFEVLKELKKDKKTKNIPVLILSNLGQREEIKKGKKLGAVDYLVKADFKLEEILDKIDNIIKKNKKGK